MSEYIYKCSTCNREYNPQEIESDFIYLCPSCGKTTKNKPLEGVLTIEYSYWELRKNLNRDKFLSLIPGRFWLYPDLWPLSMMNLSENIMKRLALPPDLLLEYNLDGTNVLLLDETRNPTLSYKDRASSLVALKALQLGVSEISAASTGNAGSSMAGICAKLGLKSNIFVPSSIPDAKRVQIQSFGANLFIVEGSYDDAFDLCLGVSSKKKWYNRNTAYNPLTIEGKKSAAYDIFISSKGDIPDIIFVPVGDGVIISGIFKGFRELYELGWIDQIPKLIAVQSTASDALVRYLDTGRFEFKSAYTLADSISAGAPRNLYMAAECVNKTGGKAVAVTDTKILAAQKLITQKTGILAEPSSAASLAGFIKMRETGEVTEDEKVLLLITGNGLKDVSALNAWNEKPAVKDPSQWKAYFKLK